MRRKTTCTLSRLGSADLNLVLSVVFVAQCFLCLSAVVKIADRNLMALRVRGQRWLSQAGQVGPCVRETINSDCAQLTWAYMNSSSRNSSCEVDLCIHARMFLIFLGGPKQTWSHELYELLPELLQTDFTTWASEPMKGVEAVVIRGVVKKIERFGASRTILTVTKRQ